MAYIDENTVSVEHQIQVDEQLVPVGPQGAGLRVLFVGNSITQHNPAPAIGWHYNWGMSASCPEKDYVHLCAEQIRKSHSDAAFAVCRAGKWEKNSKEGEKALDLYQASREYNADVLVLRFVENCPKDVTLEHFLEEYSKFVDYLNPTGKAKVIVTTAFWPNPLDEAIRTFAAQRGYPLVELGDLGKQDEMKAIGLFEHTGVAKHPGDLGMEHIARRILEAFPVL